MYSHPIWAGSRICFGHFTAVVLTYFRKRMEPGIIPKIFLAGRDLQIFAGRHLSVDGSMPTDSTFATLIRFDRHDTALSPSKLPEQIGSSVECRRQIARVAKHQPVAADVHTNESAKESARLAKG